MEVVAHACMRVAVGGQTRACVAQPTGRMDAPSHVCTLRRRMSSCCAIGIDMRQHAQSAGHVQAAAQQDTLRERRPRWSPVQHLHGRCQGCTCA